MLEQFKLSIDKYFDRYILCNYDLNSGEYSISINRDRNLIMNFEFCTLRTDRAFVDKLKYCMG